MKYEKMWYELYSLLIADGNTEAIALWKELDRKHTNELIKKFEMGKEKRVKEKAPA